MTERHQIPRVRRVALALVLLVISCRTNTDPPEGTPPDFFADCIHPEVVEGCADGWCRIPAGC